MKALFQHFNTVLPITEKEIEEMTPFLRERTLQKDDFLLRSNQVCQFMGFIDQGSFRSYHIKSNGEPSNLMLNGANEFLCDLDSLLSQEPSSVFIQAIETSEITLIAKDHLNKLYENSLYWNVLGRKMTESIFIVSKRRMETLLYKKPLERYMELIEHSPEFFDKYSLTDIASFIGVTPQSLSRIRAKVSKPTENLSALQ